MFIIHIDLLNVLRFITNQHTQLEVCDSKISVVFCFIMLLITHGRMQDFSGGGGPTLKFLGFWIYVPRSGMSRAAKLRALLRGFGGMPPKKFFKNGAILCVLKAIFNHFHGKKPLKKL